MIKYWIPILMLLLVIQNSQSQDSTAITGKSALKNGMWALQFQVGGNFTLTSVPVSNTNYTGGALSLKHQLTSDRAWRFTAWYSGGGTTPETPLDTMSYYASELNYQIVDLANDFLWYVPTSSRIHLYLGFGPMLFYTHNKRVGSGSKYINNVRLASRHSSTEESWGIGLNAILGTEWFVADELSLFTEYRMKGTYSHIYSNESDEILSTGQAIDVPTKSHSFSFPGSRVLFGLAAYF